MKKKRVVLVTGGAGYIGSHACKALSIAGYLPVTYDNLVYGHESFVKWGPFVLGDLTDRDRLNSALKQYKPCAVMHFAAYAYVGESVENPGKYYRNNVYGSINLLESMRDNGIKRIIFSSTCATYGIPTTVPIRENQQQSPINPYGMSKLMVERILSDFYKAHGIQYTILRYFNAAGADPESEIGEYHDPETHLIPLILDVAAGKRESITVYGNDYDTPDGTCIRDYIHVSDLANAHLLALSALEDGRPSTSYNLGNGQGYSVTNVINTASKITGKIIRTTIGDRRKGDPPILVGDSSKIIEDLGWEPNLSELDKIIRTAWIWMHNYQKKCN